MSAFEKTRHVFVQDIGMYSLTRCVYTLRTRSGKRLEDGSYSNLYVVGATRCKRQFSITAYYEAGFNRIRLFRDTFVRKDNQLPLDFEEL